MAKTKEVKEKKITPKIKCTGSCGKELVINNFYDTTNPLFPSGKLTVCKHCLKEMIDYNNIDSIYKILRLMDRPFLYDYWSKCVEKSFEKKSDIFGNYIRQVSSLNQLKNLKWEDSQFDSSVTLEKDNSDTVVKREEKNEMIYSETWRGTYSKSDLEYLESYYKDLESDFKIVTRNHKDYARKIAKASLAMDRAYDDMLNGVQGSDSRYKNLKDTFDTLSKSAQFSEDKRGANDVGLGCFGVVFDRVEKKMWIPQHQPVEKDDYDKLIDYFSTINNSL